MSRPVMPARKATAVHDQPHPRRVVAMLGAIAMALGPQIAAAEIFRCVANNGLPLYQNFPCEFDSLAMVPVSLTARPEAPRAMPAVVAVPNVPGANQPRPGMSPSQVRELLGEPLEIVAEDTGDRGPTEVWRYLDKRIEFDAINRVANVDSWN